MKIDIKKIEKEIRGHYETIFGPIHKGTDLYQLMRHHIKITLETFKDIKKICEKFENKK